MNRKKLKQILVIVMALILTACNSAAEAEKKAQLPEGAMGGTVITVETASKYVILELEYEGRTFWAAAALTAVETGDLVELVGPMMMKDFTVKSLDRTFDEIYFASGLIRNGGQSVPSETEQAEVSMPAGHPDISAMQSPHGTVGGQLEEPMKPADVVPLEDGISIQQLLDNPGGYAGKTIRIRGQITKFMGGIMKRNWLHVRDNSCGTAHLTVTTDETVAVGQVGMITGVVAVDQDFGHGYSYPVLVEKATFQPE